MVKFFDFFFGVVKMPKLQNFQKNSIIYFPEDIDERVFILQKGSIILTSTDIETKSPVVEQIKTGEFFGVKSALGRFPRGEKATAMQDSMCVTMTVPEFEKVFSSNKALIMKMLRVFSNQLRQIHKKTESLLNKGEEINQQEGLYSVAEAFFNEEKWRSCADVCQTYIRHFPSSSEIKKIAEMFSKANAYVKKTSIYQIENSEQEDSSANSSLKIFELPAFKRFAKTYQDGEVIITEFEPGDSFYLIQKGLVQITKCANKTNKNLDILKAGDFFGEMAILDNSPRSATCVAKGKVECLEFNKENFEVLVTGNPQIAILLLKIFCKRINDQKRRFKTLVISDPQARLADVFCMFNEMTPNFAPDHKRKFNLTISDMIHWSGLSASTVQDEISKFVKARKIEVYETYMNINNINDMKRIVDTRSMIRG